METEGLLVGKLDLFIRKYYKNSIIRGTLKNAALLSGCYLLFILLENLFRFDTPVRMVLFYLFVAIASFSIFYWIIRPVGALLRIGKRISREQAALIVGEHFTEISDKLLNALQLIGLKGKHGGDDTLLVAAIDQRIKNLKVFEFEKVISLKTNLKYLKLALPPVAVILLAWIIWPGFITEPTRRIVVYGTETQQEFPFEIRILNERLEAYQQDDLELNVQVTGKEIPADIYIQTEGYSFRMKPGSNRIFSYLFKSLQEETSFRITTERFKSREFVIKVFPKPAILSFIVSLTYPSYTGKEKEIFGNTGDIIAPEGTIIEWEWNTKDAEELFLRLPDKNVRLEMSAPDRFFYRYKCVQTGKYSITPVNVFSREQDSLAYRIICVEDGYPSIQTEILGDTTDQTRLFFKGIVKDDYGFTKLEFNYSISGIEDTVSEEEKTERIPVRTDVEEDIFFHSMEIGQVELDPGEKIRYYFEIWDNDGIRGPKPARSEIREISTMTIDELRTHAEETEKEIRKDLSESKLDAKDIRNAIDQLNRKLLEKRNLDWQEREDIGELIRRNEEMLKTIEEILQNNLKNIATEENFIGASENVIEKQKRLQELMEELMTDEMKETLEEMKKLIDQVETEKLRNLIEEMKLSAGELERQLDRNLELFRQIEFQRKLEENISRLRESAGEMKKLAEETEKQNKSADQQRSGQRRMAERYDSIKLELRKLQQMEKELQIKMDMNTTKAKQDSISETMTEAGNKIDENKVREAAKAQKNAGRQMEELADQLEMMEMESEMEGYAEDARQIRQILEHLLTVSFSQEVLLEKSRTVSRNDPGFQKIITDQKQLAMNLEPVRDSLIELGKRQFMIQPVIGRELSTLERNMDETVRNLSERNMAKALTGEQFSMTALNNLAVLLEEAMEQMNRNMKLSLMGKSSKMCQNPSLGRGKKSMKDIRQMQQKLSEQMEQMLKGMQEQMNKKGQKSTEGKGSVSERIARMAAEQEAIREELQRYSRYLREQGAMEPNGLNEAIQGMEKNENELINRQLTQESLLRQRKIVTRLLESERAEQIREQQEQRESNEAKYQKRGNPGQNSEYNKYSLGGADVLGYRTLPVNRYYKVKANAYLIQINR